MLAAPGLALAQVNIDSLNAKIMEMDSRLSKETALIKKNLRISSTNLAGGCPFVIVGSLAMAAPNMFPTKSNDYLSGDKGLTQQQKNYIIIGGAFLNVIGIIAIMDSQRHLKFWKKKTAINSHW